MCVCVCACVSVGVCVCRPTFQGGVDSSLMDPGLNVHNVQARLIGFVPLCVCVCESERERLKVGP